LNLSGCSDLKAQRDRTVIKASARRGGFQKLAPDLIDGSVDLFAGESPSDHRSIGPQVTMEHEAAFDRIHRPFDPLDAVHQTIIEYDKAVEARLDGIEQATAGLRRCEVAAKQVAFVQHDGFASAGFPSVAGQRIDESERTIAAVVVQVLTAIADIEAE